MGGRLDLDDERTEGIDGWTDGRTDRPTAEERTDRWTNRPMDAGTAGRTDLLTDRFS